MEKFTLTSTIIIEEDLEANVCLKPTNEAFKNYIATYKVYSNETEALNDLDNFIAEMTIKLYNDLPTDIAINYYL
jgi:hypothetical protein